MADDRRLDEVVKMCQEALAGIAASEDLDAGAADANMWAVMLREQADDAAALRTSIIGQIWLKNRLSLAALAHRVGISKARADQITRKIRKVGLDG